MLLMSGCYEMYCYAEAFSCRNIIHMRIYKQVPSILILVNNFGKTHLCIHCFGCMDIQTLVNVPYDLKR